MANALSHPARVRILRHLLRGGERPVWNLAQHVALALATISEHLRVLREAGLVHSRKIGTTIWYRADRRPLQDLGKRLRLL